MRPERQPVRALAISNQFTRSLKKIDLYEFQAKLTLSIFIENPTDRYLNFKQLDDVLCNFWSIRVTKTEDHCRIIIFRHENLNVVCYIDTHDEAYDWAENTLVDVKTIDEGRVLIQWRSADDTETIFEEIQKIYRFVQSDLYRETLEQAGDYITKAYIKKLVRRFMDNPHASGLVMRKIEDHSEDPHFWVLPIFNTPDNIHVVIHRSRYADVICYVGTLDDTFEWVYNHKLIIRDENSHLRLEWTPIGFEPTIVANVEEPTPKPKPEIIMPKPQPEPSKITDEEYNKLIAHLPPDVAQSVAKALGMPPPNAATQVEEQISVPAEYPDASKEWMIYLHASQEEAVSKTRNGPTKVLGVAGTGKNSGRSQKSCTLSKTALPKRIRTSKGAANILFDNTR